MKVNIALLTVTDTRTIDNDKSGGILVNKIKEADHNLVDRKKCLCGLVVEVCIHLFLGNTKLNQTECWEVASNLPSQ